MEKRSYQRVSKRVRYSTFSWLLTGITLVALGGGGVWCVATGMPEKGWTLLILLVIILLPALFFAPVSVLTDGQMLAVRRPLKTKYIHVDDIAEVRYAPPTMGAKRICASGGFLGYWGWFNEKPEGNYFGYFGRSSDTFLLILKNGRQYMIGCDDSSEVADILRNAITPDK